MSQFKRAFPPSVHVRPVAVGMLVLTGFVGAVYSAVQQELGQFVFSCGVVAGGSAQSYVSRCRVVRRPTK